MSVLVLVVDDEPDIEALFRQQFRRDVKAGRFDLEFATSGEQALTIVVEARERDIILLLSDVNMPGMGGFDLLRRVKEQRPDLPVIMITAYADPQTRRRALEQGADDLLPKPVDFASVRAEVDRRLASWTGGKPAP
ncbi:response regulator [Falsiroseomonas sp.]|uniref:response regulator n=1 Tax=Falsiroseomonas sp. TaxID=2870721 RepID=UPI0035617E20